MRILRSIKLALSLCVVAWAARVSSAHGQESAFTYPVDGATSVDGSQAFTWTAVPNAQGYYLMLGTTPGTNDIFDSGTLQTTSFAPSLPGGQTIYATIMTEAGGIWYSSGVSFTTSASPVSPIATFLYPTNGATNVDGSEAFTWTAVPNAQSYELMLGTTPGDWDILDSEMQTTSLAPNLPPSQTIYATVWTYIGNYQYSSTISFTTWRLLSRQSRPFCTQRTAPPT
jgi:hypothetical protein